MKGWRALLWDITRLLVAGWVGFMLATAGIAIWPVIGQPAARLICPGSKLASSSFSTPTSSTVTRTFLCPNPGGPVQNVTVWVAVVSGLIYSAAGYALGTVYSAARSFSRST